MEPRTPPELAALGKGLVQINLRLNRITELLERTGGGSADNGPNLDLLLDLLDAVGRVLEAGRAPVVAPSGWRRWLRVTPGPALDLNGLSLARDEALAQLAAAGVQPAPRVGRVDPHLHRVVEVREGQDPTLDGTIALTHRGGWYRAGPPPVPVRHAHVTAWRVASPPPERAL